MPPAQMVSPTHWSTPYFSGIEISVAKASSPPTRTQLMMYFAPAIASRRSVVAVTFAGQVVDGHDLLDDLADHVEIVRIDVGQRELAIDEFGHAEQVRDQRLGEAD